jgi:hypothetical protein
MKSLYIIIIIFMALHNPGHEERHLTDEEHHHEHVEHHTEHEAHHSEDEDEKPCPKPLPEQSCLVSLDYLLWTNTPAPDREYK